MKRFSYILLGVLAIFMTSCSKDTPTDPNLEPWVSDLNLPVPVEIGSSGFQFETKADKIDENNLSESTLRLFAIDKSITGLENVNADDSKRVLFHNEKAKYDSSTKRIKFDEGKVWYYPYASANNYTFYAYYAGENDLEVQFSPSLGYYVRVDMNENQSDILWAKAEAQKYDGLDGFNAKYIRKVVADNKKEEYFPKLDFKHLTTALTFKFQKEAGTDETAGDLLKQVKIDSLKFPDLHKKLNLWLTGSRQGTLDKPAQTNNQELGIEMDCGDTGILIEELGTSTTLGTMFVAPLDATNITAKLWVSVPKSSINGEYNYDTVCVEMDLTNAEDDGKFKIGHEYSYTIIMKASNEIEIIASVQEWEDGKLDPDKNFELE